MKVVDVPSISCEPDHLQDTADALAWYQKWAEDLGGTVKEVMLADPKYPGVLEISFGNDPEKKTVCTYGHMDVQPVTRSNWSTEPFEMTVKDEKLYGRGTSSWKGPIVSWLWVVEAFKNIFF